jgi:hypothetical protein
LQRKRLARRRAYDGVGMGPACALPPISTPPAVNATAAAMLVNRRICFSPRKAQILTLSIRLEASNAA